MATDTAGTTARAYPAQLVHYLRKGFVFSSAAQTLTVGTIPAGGIVIDAGCVVTTAFNSGTSDVLDIGTAADTDGFMTLVSIATAGVKAADELATSNDVGSYTADTVIKAVYTPTGTAATTGAGEVFVTYLLDNDG